MRGVKALLFLVLAVCECTAFTTKKRDNRRPTFKGAPSSPAAIEVIEEQPPQQLSAVADANTAAAGPMFAMPPTAMAHAATSLEEDEEDIGYGVAVVSCFLSLALGFGLGYGT